MRFTQGITFDFADNTLVPAGGRLVLVKNRPAFETRYAASLGAVVFATDVLGNSEFGGRLSNDGETLTLLGAGDVAIHSFTYNDQLPWPPAADGTGSSLVLKSPAIPIPDHALASSWVASAEIGGAPGGSASFGFSGDPDADDDGDGFSALVEYGLGTSDSDPGDAALAFTLQIQALSVGGSPEEFLTVSYTFNLEAQNAVSIDPQISQGLTAWSGEPDLVFVSSTPIGDGQMRFTYRSATPFSESDQEFIRLLVSQ